MSGRCGGTLLGIEPMFVDAAEVCPAKKTVLRKTPSSSDDGVLGQPTLKDLGITRDQSSDWQRLATVPEREFEKHLAKAHLPTTRSMLAGLFVHARRAANQRSAPVTERTCTVTDLGLMTETFGTIYEAVRPVTPVAPEPWMLIPPVVSRGASP